MVKSHRRVLTLLKWWTKNVANLINYAAYGSTYNNFIIMKYIVVKIIPGSAQQSRFTWFWDWIIFFMSVRLHACVHERAPITPCFVCKLHKNPLNICLEMERARGRGWMCMCIRLSIARLSTVSTVHRGIKTFSWSASHSRATHVPSLTWRSCPSPSTPHWVTQIYLISPSFPSILTPSMSPPHVVEYNCRHAL